jgi:hypothetical protein
MLRDNHGSFSEILKSAATDGWNGRDTGLYSLPLLFFPQAKPQITLRI